MAIHRGAQSALHYYLSCVPYYEWQYRRQKRRDAALERKTREARAAADPNMYRQALPRDTNPHWQTEIIAGPVLASRGKKKSPNNGSGRKRAETSTTQRSNISNVPSSLDLSSRGESRDGRNDSKLDFRRYQREDEELLVSPAIQRFGSRSTFDASLQSKNDVTKPPQARVRISGIDDCATYRAPQVNDLHPATVTKLSSRSEAAWLMQPPPTADFMSGRSMASRSRSDSGGSSKFSARSGVPLSREVSNRMVERRLRDGQAPFPPPISREGSSQTTNDARGQQHDRSVDHKDFAEAGNDRVRSANHYQVSDESDDTARTMIRNPELAPAPLAKQKTRKVASRPQLSTIVSDSIAGSEVEDNASIESAKEDIRHSSGDSMPDHDRTARRSALTTNHDSLKAFHDLAPHPPVFRTHYVSSDDLTRASRHQSQDAAGEDSKMMPSPELVDSWYTADFALPEWIHEHTKREVKHRWSMDI